MVQQKTSHKMKDLSPVLSVITLIANYLSIPIKTDKSGKIKK